MPAEITVHLAYGRGGLPVQLPAETTVISPAEAPGLADERAALVAALEAPIGAAPLRQWLHARTKICLVFTDITRATPNERLIPWLLAYLEASGVCREQIVLLNATGTHRPNTREELETLLTPEVVAHHEVVNHDCRDEAMLVQLGVTRDGTPAKLNRLLVEADVRIVTGFIEPHFFAGFSGGPKGIMPGVAGLDTVVSNHGSGNIGSGRAVFGVTDGNPLWEELRDIALRPGPSFLVNVTLNEHREITGVFAGDLLEAHSAGIEFVRESAMQPVDELFDIVVTTNAGYPLDMNLYQAVKGMSAAARIVKENGLIVLAAQCCEGIPSPSPHAELLASASNSGELLARVMSPGFSWPEQWSAHIQTLIQSRARVCLFSDLPKEIVHQAHLEVCPNIAKMVREEAALLEPGARIAVLPQGPLTIPYLRTQAD